MAIKRFYFEGKNTAVVEVGLRPSAIHYATSLYNLKAVAHNIIGKTPDKNRVEVIVEGNPDSINLFYDYVSKNDIRKKQEGPKPELSKLQTYKGKPDWNYCLNTVNAEQMNKGIDALAKIGGDMGEMKGVMKEMKGDMKEMKDAVVQLNENINNIGGTFVEMIRRYGIFGEKMDTMLEYQKETKGQLEKLDYLKDIKDLLQKKD